MTTVGFTGSRLGMTTAQRISFSAVMGGLAPACFRHGDCVGADTEAHFIVRRNHVACQIVAHPSNLRYQRGFCKAEAEMSEKPPLERNQDIVDASEVLVALPADMSEQQRSGTWSTIRRARKAGKRLITVYPDGHVVDQPARDSHCEGEAESKPQR